MEATPSQKTRFWKRKGFLWTVGILVGVPFIVSLVDDPKPTVSQVSVPQQQVVATTDTTPKSNQTSKAQAQKELDSVMTLSKKAGLVTSYEFSDSANVVYVGSVWYTQTVQFKKDFLAKVSTLKESITGYHRFEVRDANSNEKVAEVTAFSGAFEVYK